MSGLCVVIMWMKDYKRVFLHFILPYEPCKNNSGQIDRSVSFLGTCFEILVFEQFAN